MKISENDYKLLVGVAEFHFKFSEYIKEYDKELFFRAVDYAKTFASKDGIEFDYWHEDNPKFLEELNTILEKKIASFKRLVSKVGNEKEAEKIWMKKKGTNREDVLGMNNYLMNFIQHARELKYDDFSDEDWTNFVNICKYIKNDPKFIEFAISQTIRVLGENNIHSKELKSE